MQGKQDHRRGSSVAHEHGEHADDNEKSEKNNFRLLSEKPEKELRHHSIHTILGSHYGKYEAAHEEHYYRIGERSHYGLVVYKGTAFRITKELQSLV